jgi:hypothetical protein
MQKRARTAMEDHVNAALVILSAMGRVTSLLQAYKCKEALEAVNLLPGSHASSGWAFCQQGRAYFELTDYKAVSQLERV